MQLNFRQVIKHFDRFPKSSNLFFEIWSTDFNLTSCFSVCICYDVDEWILARIRMKENFFPFYYPGNIDTMNLQDLKIFIIY